MVIHKIFSKTASRFPGKAALQVKIDDRWLKFTYKDTDTLSQKIATFLVKEGFKKGDFAGIILENRPEWPIIYLGIIYAGLSAVPLDPQLNPQELRNLINDSSAKIVFSSHRLFKEKIKEALQGFPVKIVVLGAGGIKEQGAIDFSQLQSIPPDASCFPEVFPEDIASLIYTSGTTAKPKGVLLSHKNICSNFGSIAQLNLCNSSDTFLSILPLHHTYAFMVTLVVPLFLGATVIYSPLGFKPADLTRIIREAGVSVLVGVPQLFFLLHKAILERIKKIPDFLRFFILSFIRAKVKKEFGASLRLLVSGGARLTPEVGRDLSRLLAVKLIEGYGLTETSPVVTLNPPQKIKFGSVGKSLPGVEIRILNPDASGIGQVLIKGPNVMKGYFNQPDSTREVIKSDWFYSGDLGYIDREGYLFITGREKEVIVLSSGKNIYPEELEEYYSQSPYVKEICILAIQEERFGSLKESLHAVVVPNLEHFQQKNETDIRGKVRWELENLGRNIPAYKHIMGFTVIKEELPRTPLKKLKRYQVRRRYIEKGLLQEQVDTAKSTAEDNADSGQYVIRRLKTYMSAELNKPVSLESHLEIDLGVDSLTRVELGLGLEALFNVKIPDELLHRISTVKEMAVAISDIINKTPQAKELQESAQRKWYNILTQAPGKDIADKIRIQPCSSDKLFTWLFKGLFLFAFRVFWRLKIEGRQFLPRQGPYIIAPNHASYLDGFAVFVSLPYSVAVNIFFLGYSIIFNHPLVRWLVKMARLIPIDPNLHLIEAMQAVSFVLSRGKIACIFPEGRRSIDDNIGEFKKGVGILIKELDIPVVPVYIKGSHYAWPRGSRLPRLHSLRVIFGKPFSLRQLLKKQEDKAYGDDYERVADALRKEVINLTC